MRLLRILAMSALAAVSSLAADFPADSAAARLYDQARDTGRRFAEAENLKPEIRATSGGKSFLLVWKSSAAPKRWIASLHGAGRPARGFATEDLAIWAPHLKGRDVGLICLQWWLGTGDTMRDFLTPEQIYREFDLVLQSLDAKPGSVMFHGFSRGSANSYAVVALDAGRGKKYFSLAVASSGGVGLDYGPTRSLLAGRFGDQPLRGTRWITVAGARDPEPDRDGIPGMRRTADWLKEQGAVVIASIEDEKSGHGALMTNPKNAKQVLDVFLK